MKNLEIMNDIHVALVVPCYNEEKNLAATCASLGFGINANKSNVNELLFIVDNNSTDATVVAANQIKLNSFNDTVFIGYEQERGFVPPRHRGNLMVEAYARSKKWSLDSILVLQIDADTIYSDNYIVSMKEASKELGLNALVEARVDYPFTFKYENLNYINLCERIDETYAKFYDKSLDDDDIIDDKVSGYRLSDYFNWGGHRREYSPDNDEIYAETTRLYLSAKANGAKRSLVDDALAFHSPRRIYKNPLLHLATAGFPREETWNSQWMASSDTIVNMQSIFSESNITILSNAIYSRKIHLLALFIILPIHVDQALCTESSIKPIEFVNIILTFLPERTQKDLSLRPGIFLYDVFNLMANKGDDIIEISQSFL